MEAQLALKTVINPPSSVTSANRSKIAQGLVMRRIIRRQGSFRIRHSPLFTTVNELSKRVVLHAELASGLCRASEGINHEITKQFVEQLDVHRFSWTSRLHDGLEFLPKFREPGFEQRLAKGRGVLRGQFDFFLQR